ncbi:hypothetical protein Csa_015619 [Cucumis sativus]|nr:hypothetical protein Csa_015619 [Cucumis sativus]
MSYYASLLQSCVVRKAIEPGKQLHARICQNFQTKSVPLECYDSRVMAFNGLKPTEGTFVISIAASADNGLLPQGKELHGYSWRHGFESNDKWLKGPYYAQNYGLKFTGFSRQVNLANIQKREEEKAFRELRAKAQLKRTFGKVGRNESSLHNIRRLLVLK